MTALPADPVGAAQGSALLASYANLSLYLAMAVLTLAMIAFAVHVAFSAHPVDSADADTTDLDTAGAGTARAGTARAAAARTPALTSDPVLVVAGTSGSVTSGPRRSAELAQPAGQTAAGQTAGPATPASSDPPDLPPGPGRGSRSGRLGMTLAWLGAMLLVLSVVLRGLSVHRAPVGNMFEFAVFGSMLVMLVYLGMAQRFPVRWLGLFVVLPVVLTLGLALTVWYTEAAELLPSLKSIWLAIHVPVATLSVAVFTIGFSVLLLHLAQAHLEARPPGAARPRWAGFMAPLPSARTLDRTAYSLHVVAFPLWTFSLIAGAIWAQQAWGSYWNWDPKEVWTFVVWVIYAAYLHARATSGWSLRTANILAILGYLAIIINFAVVNVFFIGQHSYSGLG